MLPPDPHPSDPPPTETVPDGAPFVLPVGELTEPELRAFVGSNAGYYLRKWGPALADGGTGAGFNWAAFFLAGLWLPYRKMYLATTILFGIILLTTILEEVVVAGGGQVQASPLPFDRFVGIGAGLVCGLFGNQWYLGRARRAVAAVRSQGLPADDHLRALSKRGGTSIIASLGLCTVFVAVAALTMMLLESAATNPVERGNDLARSGDTDGAIAAYTEALRQTPNDAYALGNRGIAYVQRQDFALALADLNQALALGPPEADWIVNRAFANSALGHVDQAIGDYDAALRLRPSDAYARQQRAHLLSDRGFERHQRRDFDGAIRDYDLSLADYPNNAVALGNRGMAYVNKLDYARGRDDLDRALVVHPEAAVWWSCRGNARWGLGDLDGALDDYAAALRLTPENTYPRRQRGCIFLIREKYAAALDEFDAAAKAGDDAADLKAGRGQALLHLARYAEAGRELEEGLRTEPEHPGALYDLVWLRAACPDPALRDGPRAAAMANRLCETSKWSSANHLAALAASEAECGNFDVAVRIQEDALRKAPADGRTFHEQMLALYRFGRPYRMGEGD